MATSWDASCTKKLEILEIFNRNFFLVRIGELVFLLQGNIKICRGQDPQAPIF